jgi:hypothetical protein
MFLTQTVEVLKFLLPAIVLYFTVRMAIKAYYKNEEKKTNEAKRPDTSSIVLPLQLQAYERFILLLERMTPAQAINRAMQPGMTTYLLQMILIQSIREEFEHNAAQQIYISQKGWVLVKTAKEEVIHMINSSATKIEASSPAGELARNIFERWAEIDHNPVQAAIDQLKAEVSGLILYT